MTEIRRNNYVRTNTYGIVRIVGTSYTSKEYKVKFQKMSGKNQILELDMAKFRKDIVDECESKMAMFVIMYDSELFNSAKYFVVNIESSKVTEEILQYKDFWKNIICNANDLDPDKVIIHGVEYYPNVDVADITSAHKVTADDIENAYKYNREVMISRAAFNVD